MRIEDVDVIKAEPLQTLIDTDQKRFAIDFYAFERSNCLVVAQFNPCHWWRPVRR